MSSKIVVGGPSWGTDDDGLRAAFESYGEVVDAKVITDRDTGRSRGFGCVTFDSAESASSAAEGMNGSTLDGRTLNVDIARERAPRRDRGGYGGGGGGNRW